MARKRGRGRNGKVTGAVVAEAVSDAVTRAVHKAPESLLRRFEGEALKGSSRRLALRVMMQLEGDGWWEKKRKRAGERGLFGAIATGLVRSGPHLLAVLPEIREVNGRLLDGVGRHAGDSIATTMKREGVTLGPAPWTVAPRRRRRAG